MCHNIVDFSIAISPTGTIIFVSKYYSVQVSDKHLTAHSDFLTISFLEFFRVLADQKFDEDNGVGKKKPYGGTIINY